MPQLKLLEFLVDFTGAFMWLQHLLGFIARHTLRTNDAALSELFAFPPLGGLLAPRKPYLMRVRYFLPWVAARSIASSSTKAQVMVWATRLSGTAFLLGFLAIFSTIAYMMLHEA
jgi:hypothetical protein